MVVMVTAVLPPLGDDFGCKIVKQNLITVDDGVRGCAADD
jgi:hypothetical protein